MSFPPFVKQRIENLIADCVIEIREKSGLQWWATGELGAYSKASCTSLVKNVIDELALMEDLAKSDVRIAGRLSEEL